ncbi:MAG: tRNA uridine-5-carboxymethylaminomethyl(34) synthesis GTPase MnmE, partial [Ignavibacteriaceae bacterium]
MDSNNTKENIIVEDTIAAVATPPGVGAISIIRVSGSNAINVVDSVFIGKEKLFEVGSNTIVYGKIIDYDGNLVDDVLVSVFRNPHSYTGEDSVEISTHGNPLISQKIIELLIKKGIRAAEPGEFTKRAFLNNKIDLAQAESVVD